MGDSESGNGFSFKMCWMWQTGDGAEKVQAMITTAGAAITNVDEWGKKQLAYEIQKMKEGYYYFIQFEGETTVPAELEERLRIEETVLRFLCVKQDA